MHVQKGRKGRRMRVALMPALLAATLVLVAAGRGGIGNKPDAAGRAAQPTAGGGFGEVYKANPATLKKTLFSAKLLPSNKMARNIALAAYGRADKKVNQNLALKCWKNNGCSTGTGGKLTVAYVEGFGENVYRQISKMEFILQALTYPQVGKIIYSSAHSDPAQALTDFRAAIEGRHPGRNLCVGLREWTGHQLPDGRRRGHVPARQGVRESYEPRREVGRHCVPRRLPG